MLWFNTTAKKERRKYTNVGPPDHLKIDFLRPSGLSRTMCRVVTVRMVAEFPLLSPNIINV